MTTYTDRQKACIAALQEALYEWHELWINGPQAISILEHLESTSPITGFSEPDGGADVRGDTK